MTTAARRLPGRSSRQVGRVSVVSRVRGPTPVRPHGPPTDPVGPIHGPGRARGRRPSVPRRAEPGLDRSPQRVETDGVLPSVPGPGGRKTLRPYVDTSTEARGPDPLPVLFHPCPFLAPSSIPPRVCTSGVCEESERRLRRRFGQGSDSTGVLPDGLPVLGDDGREESWGCPTSRVDGEGKGRS